MITTEKVAPGEFKVLLDGQPTKYAIVNGSHGYFGQGAQNIYGITWSDKILWIGSVASCEIQVALWLNK